MADCTDANLSYSYSFSYDEYNSSSADPSDALVKVVVISILSIVTVTGLIGNSLVLFSLCMGSRKLGITSILLGSLALTDFFINAWYVPVAIYHYITPVWRLGAFLCISTSFVGVFAQSSSACMLLVISCERFLVILFPLTSRTMLTRKRTFILVMITWITAAGLAAFPTSYMRLVVEVFCRPYYSVQPICKPVYEEAEQVAIFFYILFVLYLIPLGGMATANTCVIIALIKSSRYTKKLQSMKSLEKGVRYSSNSSKRGEKVSITEQPLRGNNSSHMNGEDKSSLERMAMDRGTSGEDPFPPVQRKGRKRSKRVKRRGQGSLAQRQRVIVMLMSVVVLYALCWLPYFIFGMMHIFMGASPYDFHMILFECFTKIMSSFNSAVNPIVYGFMSKNFRQSIVHAFTRCLNCRSNRRNRATSFGSAYTVSTRGSAMYQHSRNTRYTALSKI